jgi:DNA-binding response OmpR family regulator
VKKILTAPEINGYEICRRLKQNGRFQNIPVIFLSIRNDEDDIRLGYEVSGDDYIVKPSDLTELYKRINKILAEIL